MLPGALFNPSSKNKKSPPHENLLYSMKMEVSNSNITKFLIFQETKNLKKLIFSQKKAFLIFRETETLKKFFTFQKTELSCNSGGTSKAPKTKIYYTFPKRM